MKIRYIITLNWKYTLRKTEEMTASLHFSHGGQPSGTPRSLSRWGLRRL